MKRYTRSMDGPLPKGTVFMDAAGWVGIVTEAERTKNFHPGNIIQCAEMFGFEHESGSKYADEVRYVIETRAEFALRLVPLGFKPEQVYTKVTLLLT